MEITRLLPTDVPLLRRWAHDFLVDHLRWWSTAAGLGAAGLGWDAAQIDGHIVGLGLADRDVRRLQQASTAWKSNFVGVARGDGGAKGAIWAECKMDGFLAVEMGVIAWIYVSPAARGQGVGTALVEDAKAWMRQRGLTVLQLRVVEANASAIAMYKRAGLQKVDVRMMGSTSPLDQDG